MILWLVALGSFVASVPAVGIARHVALRWAILDRPNERSSHTLPTPRGGGVVIVLISLVSLAVKWQLLPSEMGIIGWLAGGASVGVVGALDDLKELSVALRLSVQFMAAIALLWSLHGLPSVPMPLGSVNLGAVGWFIGCLGVVWSTNLFNFMDGIDGLAAAQAIFIFGAGAALVAFSRSPSSASILVALAAAAFGFFLWNVSPAKIFMGDVGSGFLGFAVAAAALVTAADGSANIWTWVILDGTFVADATTTLVVRGVSGQKVREAHQSHVYQHLARRWRSHPGVTGAYTAVNVFWCLPWAIISNVHPEKGIVCVVAALAPLFLVAIPLKAGRTLKVQATSPRLQ